MTDSPSSPLQIVGLPHTVADTIQHFLTLHFGEAWSSSTLQLCLHDAATPIDPSHYDHVITIDNNDQTESSLRAPLHLSTLATTIAPLFEADTSPATLWHDWTLDTPRKQLHHPMQSPIDLTDKEVLLLQTLMGCEPNQMNKADLLEAVWGYGESVDTHTLETHIYRLRQKLEPLLPDTDKGIVTDADGYRWQS